MLALTDDVILYLEENIQNIFKKQRDINIAYAILELFKQREEIENFNKKSLYILIREMTNVNTSHITSVVNILKKSKENQRSNEIQRSLIKEKLIKEKET